MSSFSCPPPHGRPGARGRGRPFRPSYASGAPGVSSVHARPLPPFPPPHSLCPPSGPPGCPRPPFISSDFSLSAFPLAPSCVAASAAPAWRPHQSSHAVRGRERGGRGGARKPRLASFASPLVPPRCLSDPWASLNAALKEKHPHLQMPLQAKTRGGLGAEDPEGEPEGESERVEELRRERQGLRRAESGVCAAATCDEKPSEETSASSPWRPGERGRCEGRRTATEQDSAESAGVQSRCTRTMRLPPVSSETSAGLNEATRRREESEVNASGATGETVGNARENKQARSACRVVSSLQKDHELHADGGSAFRGRHSARTPSVSLSPEKKKFCLSSLPPPKASDSSPVSEQAIGSCGKVAGTEDTNAARSSGSIVRGKWLVELPPPVQSVNSDASLSFSSSSVPSGFAGLPRLRVDDSEDSQRDKPIDSEGLEAASALGAAVGSGRDTSADGGGETNAVTHTEEASSLLSLDVEKIQEKLRERRAEWAHGAEGET
ncbi:hypothetical protein TGME49_226670 [Toxoplasma gondii ME49]|uniref:Uncharacterized protein n=3 Tax=Toxoplasma gondii TaxID=5811 RepID=A0A086KLQ1_TOXGO|nr:hypothetical protein TGME49_226670 [Toxoplasma gondii ME49]EPT27162.1 hypothetical protein TGME49_226670 [Toxoplasma gondii ME49]KFG45319.1 hypothetical protein TGDOM2_226670 [Toxoplasma gondii GAB2-2007-GAL-DOM2]KYF43316.1 hypothetical protein TGARI_226670 [Toxoplasma gondii ARI]|eukprot:XP_002366320.1 hypothetical protein TGME49_226670 [Toxoplasma gondii ME49]